VKRIIKVGLGALLLLLGVIGVLLPLIPGIPFLVLGLGLLSLSSERIRRLIERFKERYQESKGRWKYP